MTWAATSAVLPARAAPQGAASALMRKCACEESTENEESRGTLSRTAEGASPTAPIPPIVHEVLHTPGQPLDPAAREFMEMRFDHDFSQIRVHVDHQAEESALAVNALAYTVGRDVVFGAGQYLPQTGPGRMLIAHELAHVVQQDGLLPVRRSPAGPMRPARKETGLGDIDHLEIASASSLLEMEADATARRVMTGSSSTSVLPGAGTPGRLSTNMLSRKVSPDYPKIKDHLKERHFWQKDISEKDSHEVLMILKGLSEPDLRDTVAEMEKAKLVETFFTHLSDADMRSEHEALRRIKNSRVWKTESKSGSTTVTTEVVGSCAPDQYQKIFQASMKGMGWLDTAIAKLDAYLAAPASQANVEAVFKMHFQTTAVDVVKHVRERLVRIRADIEKAPQFTVECHGTWDKECDVAGAYVGGEQKNLLVVCFSFFNSSADWQAEAIVHEMAHAQVGGRHITDRGYAPDRLLPLLTTEEALTNAESYGLLTQQLGTGSAATGMQAPKDTAGNCDKDWWPLVQKAIAVAQRYNREAQVELSTLTVKDVQSWSKHRQTLLGGTTQSDIDRARKVFNLAADRLARPINFQCDPKDGGGCDRGNETYWTKDDLHVCPAWKNLAVEAYRAHSLLAALYAHAGGVSDPVRANFYAAFAREIGQEKIPPSLGEILGSSKWSPDAIGILVSQDQPRSAKYLYEENGKNSERVSQDMPSAQVQKGATKGFATGVWFMVDEGNDGRPLPFSAPQVKVEFQFTAPGDGFTKKLADARPVYSGPSSPLNTNFPKDFAFSFDKNGALHMRFEIKDIDASLTRVYDDTIQIAVNP